MHELVECEYEKADCEGISWMWIWKSWMWRNKLNVNMKKPECEYKKAECEGISWMWIWKGWMWITME